MRREQHACFQTPPFYFHTPPDGPLRFPLLSSFPSHLHTYWRSTVFLNNYYLMVYQTQRNKLGAN